MALLRAFSSLGCPAATLEEALALAQRFGLGGVELRALGGTVDLPAYFEQHFGTPEKLGKQLRGAPVKILAFNTSLHLVGGTPAERTALNNLIPWAEALGVRWLRVFDGGKTGDDGEVAEAASTLMGWRAARESQNWTVDWMIETHDSLFTGQAIRKLVAKVPDVAILWDSHHTWKKGGEESAITWAAIRNNVIHVHVKDSISVPSARHPYTYVLPGAGEFPMEPLMHTLRTANFAGPVSLEWELMWHPYLPPLEEALRVAEARGWW